MKTRILDIIDFEKVNTLLEGFNQSTGFVTAILDLEGNVLSRSGWRKMCTDFHRVNSATSQRCRLSDTILAGRMSLGKKYHFYKCLNGLVDVAVPLVVKGEHIANLFSGQFFFENPDVAFFKKQAAKFGFDEDDYLKALESVPVISEEKVKTVMEFLLNTTRLISEMTFQKLELMELNNALSMSEERYRLVLENSMDAILLSSSGGKIISANRAACEMFQLSEREICTIGLRGLLDIDGTRFTDLIEERTKTGKAKGELMMLRNRVYFPVELSTSVYTDQNGNPCSSMIIRDITERKNTEEQLIIAKEKAEESSRLKTAFLQNMSHEIRTPMNAIMGFAGLLSSNFNNKVKLEKFADIIGSRCNDLLDIINDILDLAKIESGQLPVNVEEFDLNELFAELSSFFAEYQNRIDKQQIAFRVKGFEEMSGSTIVTDKVKLKQIFINLINNAFKFTTEGRIEFGCKPGKDNNVLFYVSDTGIGIPEDKQKLIFERFVQLQHSPKMNLGGTGLGLPIVKGLVDLLGGELFIESKPGRGSKFSFSIPYKTVHHVRQAPMSGTKKNADLSGKTTLIVEDDLYNFEYLKEILSETGLSILHAGTGKDAINISLEQSIDLILMDIGLPDIDGYETTRRIRQYKPHLKIIAQTAYAMHDEKQKAMNEGCDDYISKPTKKDLLLSMVSKHLSKA
ncbi:MAG TPA: PocR ligand-binding domain-containing protein [Bacteroidales bacterium]|nr:PocR ligand-binding domain-containing protein [Bacteroidales bacterium]